MHMIFRRITALLLCLTMLPLAALAEGTQQGYAFDLSFEMDASAYPEDSQEMMAGFADMLNMMNLSGTAVRQGESFDLDFDLMLNGNESTRTDFYLYGVDSNWQLESSLLGEEKVMFNNKAMLEFAMKAYYHLEMPLQYIALAVSPYAHRSAFTWLGVRWRNTFHAKEGSRKINADKLANLAAFIAENAEYKRAFYNWVCALTMELGYSDVIFESLYTLPDWLDSFLAEDSIQVTVDGDHEIWMNGEDVLFERSGDSWTLALPPSLEGATVTASCTRQDGNAALVADIATADGEALLDFDLAVSGMPDAFPFAGEMDAALSLSGLMFEEPVDLAAKLVSDGSAITLDLLNADRAAMLTVTGTIAPKELPAPDYNGDDLTGLNIFSVNDESLSAFVSNVMEPFMTGFLPLLVELPASSYNSMFELLNQYGVLDLLTGGM